jgi:integrase
MPRKGREPRVEERRHRLADGSVTTSWSVRYFDAGGARRRIGCASRAEADYQRAKMVLEGAGVSAEPRPSPAPRPVAAAAWVVPEPEAPSCGTLAEFWPIWSADASGRLTRRTLEEYDRVWRNRIAPPFGAMPLAAIRPRAISQWRAEMMAKGVGTEAIRRAMTLLQGVYTVAIEWGEAESNPVSVVRKPRQGVRRVAQAITPDGVERIRAHFLAAGDLRSATLVSVLAYAGLRPGEALALEFRHIRESTILIERALTDGEFKIQKTGRIYRTVDLLAVLAEDLAVWRAQPRPCELLFSKRDGSPWRTDDWDNWRNRHFFPAALAAGLGRPRPYDLRHSFASLMIREQRTSIVELAEQLGHAPTMTLNTYAHVFAEHRRAEPVDANEWIVRARAELAGGEPLDHAA